MFEARPFGDLERLVTQKLLDVAKRIAREELESENWLHLVARMSGRSYEEMRVTMLDFLDTDIFNISVDNCVSFLEPLIDSWDIDLSSFRPGNRAQQTPRSRQSQKVRVRRDRLRRLSSRRARLQRILGK